MNNHTAKWRSLKSFQMNCLSDKEIVVYIDSTVNKQSTKVPKNLKKYFYFTSFYLFEEKIMVD